ncbi:MAG: 50S ribosomal protein L23 [Chloroflexota bacterium]|nr:50S ribosomal protein L23 [Chloroflexota bacterium]MDE3194622.1 50S ribosomal protein L23 [Chloroflexota bacterium]
MTNTLVLLRPIVTEKSMGQTNSGKYTFEVRKDASKQEIAEAVAEAFKVDVLEVNCITVRGKTRRLGRHVGRTPDRKKAIVTVAKGQRIERYFTEGV